MASRDRYRALATYTKTSTYPYDPVLRQEINQVLDEIDMLEGKLEEAKLAHIAASNPGIDMDKVREIRQGVEQRHNVFDKENLDNTPSTNPNSVSNFRPQEHS